MLTGDPLVLDLLLLVLVPAVVGIALTRWAGRFARRLGHTPLSIRTAGLLFTAAWVAIAGFGVYEAFGPFSFFSTLTVSAIAGVAITLALQTTIQNIISGFLLLRGRFLRIGDQVQFSGVKGTVASIGLVTVMIKMDDGTLSSVSNANLLSGPLTNYTAAKRLADEY